MKTYNRQQHIVELMGSAAGEGPEGLQFLRLAELRLKGFHFRLGADPVAHIADGRQFRRLTYPDDGPGARLAVKKSAVASQVLCRGSRGRRLRLHRVVLSGKQCPVVRMYELVP